MHPCHIELYTSLFQHPWQFTLVALVIFVGVKTGAALLGYLLLGGILGLRLPLRKES